MPPHASHRRLPDWRYADHPLFDYRLFENRVNGVEGFRGISRRSCSDMPVRSDGSSNWSRAGAAPALLSAIAAGAPAARARFLLFRAGPRGRDDRADSPPASPSSFRCSSTARPQPTGVLFMAHLQKCPTRSRQDWLHRHPTVIRQTELMTIPSNAEFASLTSRSRSATRRRAKWT